MDGFTLRDWERIEKGLSLLRAKDYDPGSWSARRSFEHLPGKIAQARSAAREGVAQTVRFTELDWEHIEKAVTRLQAKEHQKLGYGKRPGIFARLSARIQAAKQASLVS